jgi:hypothetical protein
MRFLKRGSEQTDVGDFWSWWPANRDRISNAIAAGSFDDRLVNDISRAVATIHPAMAWELEPGQVAEHAFCVSPEGNAELRQAALRWRLMAPPPDATWEYHASKQAAPALSGLRIGDRTFDLAETRAISSWDEARQRVDVKLWHPGFDGAPQPLRLQVAFVFLDNLLAEDDVERWIGAIDLLDAPVGGRTPDELKAEIERRSHESAGDERWVLGTRERPDGQTEIIVADAALKRIDHPFADHHVTISLLLGVDRMPNDAEAEVLNAEEDDLLPRLAGLATYVGRTTAPGVRTLHFVTEAPEAMRPMIDAWAAPLPDSIMPGLPARRLKVAFDRDMDWMFRRDLGLA